MALHHTFTVAVLLGNAREDDSLHVDRQKRVVMYGNYGAGDVRSVVPVPAAVHVEAVAVGVFQDQVVAGLVARAGPSRTGDVVTAPVEEVGLDQRFRPVHNHAVAQTVALVVVEIVVVNVVVRGIGPQENRAVTPAKELAVVHFQSGFGGLDAPGVGDTVVPSFRTELPHLLSAPHRIRALQPESGNAHAGTGGDKEGNRLQFLRVNQAALGIGLATSAGQRHTGADLDFLVARKVHPVGVRQIDHLALGRLLERIEQFRPVGDKIVVLVDQLVVSFTPADGIARGVRVGAKRAVRQQGPGLPGGVIRGLRRRRLRGGGLFFLAAGRKENQYAETGERSVYSRCHCSPRTCAPGTPSAYRQSTVS